MNKFLLISLICLSNVFWVECSHPTSPFKKMEGKWTAAGDQGEGHSWYLEYTFKGNFYSMTGYPPISESGRMKLKESKGDSLLIEFIVEKSDPSYENHEQWVYVKDDQITMNGVIFNRSAVVNK